ncbi:MAG: SDR family oxidoreductase, partial [Chloroflexota bacterium]|nr:SDR family oxidoreductase [Chloroflexota bacterium]
MQLEGKSILVTGAARGFGQAISAMAAEEGARVAVADVNLAGVEAVAQGIRDRGGEAVAIEANVSDVASIDAMVDAVLAAFGGIDILANNAGITRVAPLLEATERDWDSIMGVNAKGAFFVLHRVAREMVARGRGGRIINMGSVVGKGGRASNAAYAASKGAVLAFTYQASSALAQHDICVNAICPGAAETEMFAGVRRQRAEASGQSYEETTLATLAGVPLGRLIDPQDIARLVVFLAGPGGRNVTGQTINIDGGVL